LTAGGALPNSLSVPTMTPTELVGPEQLRAFQGHDAVHSRWVVPSVDARTAAQSWSGMTPQAMGALDPFVLLGIMGAILPTVVRVGGRRHALNYGLDDVRFEAQLNHRDPLRVAVELGGVDGPGEWLDARWVTQAEGPTEGRVVVSAVLIVRYIFEES